MMYVPKEGRGKIPVDVLLDRSRNVEGAMEMQRENNVSKAYCAPLIIFR